MKAVWYERLGSAAEVLKFGDLPDSQPEPGEVRVAVHVSGVNPIDVKRRQGGRGTMTSPRIVPHFDGAGVIDAVGENVDSSRVGERVWLYAAQWQRDFGTAAELVSLPASQAVPLPDDCDFSEGACLGIPALTAYASVFADGEVAGKTVLVTGGAGAVGCYAVQFARLAGARVIATVSTDEKAGLAMKAGADHVLNYRETDIGDLVLEITDGKGADRIVEVEFGGNLPTSLRAIRMGGIIATYASQAEPEPKLPFYDLMYRGVVVRHVLVFGSPQELLERALVDISRWLADGELSHNIGERFHLNETIAAHEAVERGAIGKVLVDCTT
ncbi:NADPH:quinone reductase [Bythopirellula polymerisocia]|uniref:Quinone oxidoreductase 1 n=1 Tax=Bythopirellula polymerisocia TaxID=2528003 RepID=A0A5C6CIQ9_9BACT|nr:NADPH:quinone reductase [Bythopirellula polymerisocia]TWU23547.1 Quinone oxidoreductase 1 [Bythopirellula polymerisocia]